METDWIALAIAIVSGCFVVFGVLKSLNDWYYVMRLGQRGRSLPPGDMGWPLVGKTWSFYKAFTSTDPDSFVNNFIHRYGATGIYRTCVFGSPSMIVCTPETCKRVFLDDKNFGPGYPSNFDQILRRAFNTITDAAEHKRLRKLTSAPLVGHEALSLYLGYIEHFVINSLEEWSSNGRPVALLTELKNFTYSVISRIFLGPDCESRFQSSAKYYGALTRGVTSMPINFPGFAYYKGLKARKILFEVIREILEERKITKQESTKRGMIDLFLDAEDDDGRKMDDDHIADLLLSFFLAGHETSSYALMWTTVLLHQHPEVLRKAKDEQEQIIKRRPPTQKGLNMQEIKQMEYLAKVIDEALRNINISYGTFRKANSDIEINGYLVPKGWKVIIWSRGVHMDPEIYSNPKEFNPLRWKEHRPKAGAFSPFGGGNRICPGAELARLEIFVFLHHLLLNYKFEQLKPGGQVTYFPLPRPLDNCMAKITKLQ